MDLNLANQAELEMVKGVGPQLSDRILAEREHGRFIDWADFIERMKGIGPTHASRLSAAGMRIRGEPFVSRPDQAGSGAASEPRLK
ncbi:helix-hairpin-helix domain-containing protein [Ideonella sp. DXS29W]|uniref:Helix-hairpin-helix domain-containing protein n=1 Tax=Ideonella lacteola TaxID=2984193 RepID=A0ABU9BPY8_9BURK